MVMTIPINQNATNPITCVVSKGAPPNRLANVRMKTIANTTTPPIASPLLGLYTVTSLSKLFIRSIVCGVVIPIISSIIWRCEGVGSAEWEVSIEVGRRTEQLRHDRAKIIRGGIYPKSNGALLKSFRIWNFCLSSESECSKSRINSDGRNSNGLVEVRIASDTNNT